jgi:glycerophosphoryl diester phosphodiesterase
MNPSSSRKPVWISHRGYKKNAVENTAAAFQAAVDIGFRHLETDLRITRDSEIVLIHDETLARLANDLRRVRDLTRRELASFRLAAGERFLFFEQFVEMFKQCSWTLDIKPENGEETIHALAKWARQNDFENQLVQKAKFLTWRARHEEQLKSFFPGAVFYARKKECWRAGASVIAGLPFLGRIKPGRTYALISNIGKIFLFTKPVVRYFHQRNAKTIAFLPQTDLIAQQAVRAGFDEILTNRTIL